MAKKRRTAKRQTVPSIPLDRVLFYGVLLLVFALPLFIWPGISEYGYGKTIIALIGTSVLAVLWGLSAWQNRTWTIRLPWITIPVLGLVAASLLSTLHATNGRVVVQSVVLVVFFTLLMIVIANAVRDQRDVRWLLFTLLVSAFLAALYGLLQHLGIMRGPTGSGGLGAIISTMGNRNYLGGFLTYLFFPAIVLVLRPRSRWMRLVSVFLIAFCFGMILTIYQTGTLVALVIAAIALGIGLLIFRPIEPIRRNRLWLLILLGALIVTFLFEAPSGPLNSVVGLSAASAASQPTPADTASAAAANLVADGGFETDSTYWGSMGQRETSDGDMSGGWFRLSRSGSDNRAHPRDEDGSIRDFEVRPGEVYRYGASLKSDGACTARLVFRALDASGDPVAWTPVLDSLSVDWEHLEATYTVGASVRYLRLYLVAAGADGWAGFDNVALVRLKPAPSWIARWWQRNSGAVRSWDWWIGWEMFADHPLTGVGLGNYKLNFLPYKATFLATPRGEAYDFYIDRAAQAHNEYVQVLAELGILGVLALASFLAVLVVTLWKRLRSNDEPGRLELLLFTCGIATFLIHGLVSFPAHLPASSLVLILVGGLAFSRVYGDSGQFTVRLTGWTSRAVLVGVTLIGLVVSVVAVRDLSANLLMSEGIEQTQLGNPYGAESLLERSIELDFAPRQTYYHLAVVQIELGAYEEAQANLARCFTRFVDETVYLNYANLTANSRQFDLARAAITTLLASRPRTEVTVRARYLEAVIIAQSGDPMGATALLEELIADAPWFETAYIGLGTVYEARGMPVNARRAFEDALRKIDAKLETAQATLAGQTTITAEEYGRLRSEIEQLRQQRETVLDKLDRLPPA